jgi:hypothetical protein
MTLKLLLVIVRGRGVGFLKKAVYSAECFITWSVALIFRDKFDRRLYRFNVPEVWYSPWNEDDAFAIVYAAISGNTLVSKRKLYDLFCLSRQFSSLAGDYLEVGTFRGGTAGILATTFTASEMVLWDNWGVLVERDDYFVKKAYSETDDLNKSRTLLLQLAPQVLDRCSFINKPFPCESVIAGWDKQLALVHFDIYQKAAFEDGIRLIWPRIQVGGVFIVSAYGSISLDSLTRSVNEFAKKHDDCLFIISQSGMGLLIKR